jgi:hypothetical protein
MSGFSEYGVIDWYKDTIFLFVRKCIIYWNEKKLSINKVHKCVETAILVFEVIDKLRRPQNNWNVVESGIKHHNSLSLSLSDKWTFFFLHTSSPCKGEIGLDIRNEDVSIVQF